ncbi:MAG: hypothetical protein AB1529_08265 [Candidatus Micrarchaeota archaeon]
MGRVALGKAGAMALALSIAPGCFQHYGPGYQESGFMRSRICAPFCSYAGYSTHRREVQEGDLVGGALPGSSVPYADWTIMRITPSGVELAPRPDSSERVFIPYGRQESIQTDVPRPNETYMGGLLFEEGPRSGTAIMTVLERVY